MLAIPNALWQALCRYSLNNRIILLLQTTYYVRDNVGWDLQLTLFATEAGGLCI